MDALVRPRSAQTRTARTTCSARLGDPPSLADERYALTLAVLGRSLSKTGRSGRCATLYVVDGGIAPETKRHLIALAAAKHALRALAHRWLDLHREVHLHDGELDRLTQEQAPELRAAFGVGPDTAAELLIVSGDNPRRVHSEAAFAALCRGSPLPASSGQTTRPRLNRGGHPHPNPPLHR